MPFLVTEGKTSDGTSSSRASPRPTTTKIQTVTRSSTPSGHLVNSPLNSFQIYGKVMVDGQTYTGLLLQGTPTGVRLAVAQAGGPANEDIFDMTLKITGGLMASLYGPDAYIRVTTEANSTFNGVFNADFSSEKVLTNTHPLSSLLPSPPPSRPPWSSSSPAGRACSTGDAGGSPPRELEA